MKADLQKALDWLFSTQLFGIKLGLEGMRHLLAACNLAQLPQGVQVIHLAGTNGKGSTSAMIERIAREGGVKTGLFTSPHLISFHERIRVNGQTIEDAQLLRLIHYMQQVIQGWETPPSFFEIVTAMALLHFKQQACELIILETGMGGRLDATNAIAKQVAVITPIGLDHMQYLGDTLALVAAEKAGIIQERTPVVCAKQADEAQQSIKAQATKLQAPYHLVTSPYSGELSLKGKHQRENAALAIAALEYLPGFSLSSSLIERALGQVEWAGRYECISHPCGELIVDGAHNEHAMRALVKTLADEAMPPLPCLFAAASDKDLAPLLPLLAPFVSAWILPCLSAPRLLAPTEMQLRIEEFSSAPIFLEQDLRDALAHEGNKLVCGSLFLVGELKAFLAEEDYRKSLQ